MGWHEVTMMFTDIVGFTTLCEEVDPDVLRPVTTEYLQRMCSVIVSTGGALDKARAHAPPLPSGLSYAQAFLFGLS